MKRLKLIIVLLPLVLLLVSVGAFSWVMHTEPGAKWAWSMAGNSVPGTLNADGFSGNLSSGLAIRSLTYQDESIKVSTDDARLQLSIGLFPVTVILESVEAEHLLIHSTDTGDTNLEKNYAEILTALELPLALVFEKVRIAHLTYQERQGGPLFEGNDILLSGRWFKQLEIDQAQINTPLADWQINGLVGFASPFPVKLGINGAITLEQDNVQQSYQLDAQLDGDLTELGVVAQVEQPGISISGKLHHLLTRPAGDLIIQAQTLQWPLTNPTPEFSLHDVMAEVSGEINSYQAEITGLLAINNQPDTTIDFRGTGDEHSLTIERLNLSGEPISLQATGHVGFADVPRFSVDSVIQKLEPHYWIKDWSPGYPLAGRFSLEWQEQKIDFPMVELMAIGTSMSVTAKGIYDIEANVLQGQIDWKDWRWPIGSENPEFASKTGLLEVHGKPDNWTMKGDLDLVFREWPHGQIIISGAGNETSANLMIDKGEILGGEIAGRFDYDWTRNHKWSLDVRADNINTGALHQDFAGTINGEVLASGQSEPPGFSAEFKRLDGSLRGSPIEASGKISLQGNHLLADSLHIRSGDSYLDLDGNTGRSEGMQFVSHIENLDEFIDQAGGSVNAKGNISTADEQDLVDLEFQGIGLSWQDFQMDDYFLTARLASATGSLENPENLHWEGVLASLRLQDSSSGFLALEQAVELRISPSDFSIGKSCFTGSGDGRLCFDARWINGSLGESTALVEDISPNLINVILDTDLNFTQRLTGQMEWHHTPGLPFNAAAEFNLSAGQISLDDEEDEDSLKTGDAQFNFRIKQGQLLSGNLDIPFPDMGKIDTDFSAPDISQGLTSPIEGRVLIDLHDITPLTLWLASLEGADGSINADIQVSGTVGDPVLMGEAALTHGRFQHSASGLDIREIELAGSVSENDYTELNGSFRSGDGQGNLKASLQFQDLMHPQFSLDISGKDLTLIDTEDAFVAANPDLYLKWANGNLNLDGSILIPQARFSPRYLPTSEASESPDLVITAGELPPEEKATFDKEKLRITGRVTVELGDQVTFSLEHAEAKLGGAADFIWSDQLLPMADGSYTFSGKLAAYGQHLEVTEGKIIYPNRPADNPHLHIKAEREIYGNVQVKRAGILITGTLNRPVVETYTTPMTTRERAQTLLVTGSDFDFEQGVGAVEVGMYIAPKLYISYGIGLFDDQNVVSARYDLKRGFGIKATSGQRETGVDISYTIER